ncbi:MAG: TorF family putative porin [Burkholderiaceae bacterium]|nr:TorF family putative porin [Burkholderiaceae bacterium]
MNSLFRASAAAALLALPMLANAQAKPEPEFTITGNAGLFSDYRFRGFTQTGYGPAFQGGFDFAHKSGFYLGNWNSNVEQGLYNGASLEMDFYGGYKFSAGDIGFDVGYLYYYYPKSGAQGLTKVSNGELYFGASYGPVSGKFFYNVTDFFSLGKGPSLGNPEFDTSGSYYIDLNASFPLAQGFTVVGHYGYQYIKNGEIAFQQGLLFADTDNVSDWKLGVTYDLSGWILGASVIGTTEKGLLRTAESGFTKDSGKTSLVLNVSKSF